MRASEIKRISLVYGIVICGVAGFALTCVLLGLSVWWGSPAIVPGIGILVWEYQARNGNEEANMGLRSLVSITMVAAVFIWFPMIIIVIGNALFRHASGHYLNWIAVIVWPVGWIVFRFKQYNQKRYGIAEIFFGIATAFGITIKGAFGPTQALAVLGAMYVVSRGYSDITDAEKKKEEIERNAKAFHEYLGRVKIASSRLWAVVIGRDVPIRKP